MDFYEVLDQVIALLQSRGRVTYNALKRQFGLDDAYIADLRDEIIDAQQLATDENDRVLVWTGNAVAVPEPVARSSEPERDPLAYTPQHLAEKILTSRSALEGERKQVTVFFCDIANSTPLAERLGPERMHSLLNTFFELALQEVHRYEGTINQFLGDGFMALFGAPIAHEDHARRAVLAAVALRQRLHADVNPFGQEFNIEVETRMGLHTGAVIVGAIGDNLRMDYTAVGDTTNVASRLQNVAAPGQIVISEATHRLVDGYCTTRPLGEHELKGKAAPIAAWDVSATRETRTRLEVEAERGLTPFVGRERELQLLADCFAQAQSGQGQIAFLAGEAGLGKSRLLFEFRRRVGDAATWLEGHAMSFGQSMAFHPLIDLLRRNFRIEEDDLETMIIEKIELGVLRLDPELQPILPYLRYLLAVDPGDPHVLEMDPQLRRAEIFDALRRLLLYAAKVRPQILVFEDLHWMDKATEEFLLYTADSIPTSRVLCLFTYRPGYVHPFGDRTYYTRIALPTLSTTDTVHMAREMLATEHLPEELAALIVQKAEGNPFFVEEVIKSLSETGAIRRQGERYLLARPLDEIVVPDTVQDVLMARIDRLPEAPKKTLQLAAVIGREFTYRLLDRLVDIQAHTEAYVQDLKAIELIYETHRFPELAFMFKHALTQDVAYNSLLAQRRQELHGLIGRAIEDLYANRLTEQYGVLAYHFSKGQDWRKALHYLLLAAEQAAQAFAMREAISLYDQALDVAAHLGDATDHKTVMAIHQAKANIYVVLSDFERARAEYESLLAVARQAGDRSGEGAALAGIGFASVFAHDFEQALDYSQQAIAVAEATDARSILPASYLNTGFVHIVTAQLEAGHQALDQAITINRTVGDVRHQSLALIVSSMLKNWEGRFDEALERQVGGIHLAREHNLLFPFLQACFAHGITLTGMGNYDDAHAIFEEGLALSEKVDDEINRYRLLNCLGWLFIELGDLEGAIEPNRQGAESARRRGDPETIANPELNLADIYLARGDLALAQEFLDGVHRLVKDPTTSEWMKWRYATHLFASLGELCLARGDPASAQAFADQCLEIATRTNSRKNIVKGWRLKGDIAFAHRQWEEAGHWLQRALSMARDVGNPPQLWKTHLALARLHAESGQPEQARLSHQAACQVIDRVKANLHNQELLVRMERSPLIQQIYEQGY